MPHSIQRTGIYSLPPTCHVLGATLGYGIPLGPAKHPAREGGLAHMAEEETKAQSSNLPKSTPRWSWDWSSAQFSSVTQSCPTLCNPMNRSMPGLPVHHQLPEFTQTHVHRVGDAIQPSHPLSSPSPSAPNPSQHQSLFQCVNSLREVAKVLEFQL